MTAPGVEPETPFAATGATESWPVLLLEPVRIARVGSADRLDQLDGRGRESWSDHVDRLGPRPRGALWLIDALEDAHLTGHGGGHFPVARKWRSVLDTSRGISVVANGAESESLSGKDATLLRQRPHLVLDGLCSAMETVGARSGVVWLHDSDRYTHRVVEEALGERRGPGTDDPTITVVPGPSTYLAGESSAIVNALSGGATLPTYRGRRPGEIVGRRQGSTLVHNVETLARVAVAAREGSFSDTRSRLDHFAPGPRTSLLTVLTTADRQVIEVPSDLILREAVALTMWSSSAEPVAVLLGGFGGMWARWSEAADIAVNEQAMRSNGLTLGAGVVAPVAFGACGVAETARMVGYLAASSARQCGPCMFGLPALAESLERLRIGSARRGELRRLAADIQAVKGRGACHHPDGATRLVASAVERHCCIERSREHPAANLAARRHLTSRRVSLYADCDGLMAPSGHVERQPTGRSAVPPSHDGSMQQCPSATGRFSTVTAVMTRRAFDMSGGCSRAVSYVLRHAVRDVVRHHSGMS